MTTGEKDHLVLDRVKADRAITETVVVPQAMDHTLAELARIHFQPGLGPEIIVGDLRGLRDEEWMAAGLLQRP